MIKFKYIIIFIVFFICATQTEALDIQYGSIEGNKSTSVLIEYYGIGEKVNYLCNTSNLKCMSTNKTTLGTTSSLTLKNSTKTELKNNKATHITVSKSNNWIAYLMEAVEPNYTRTYVIKNIKTNKNYKISESVLYWDLVQDSKNVFEFSSDEKSLFYLDDKDGFMSLYKIKLDTLNDSKVEGIKIETSAYTISTFMYFDANNIYYVGNTKENPYIWSLYNLNLNTGIDKVVEKNVSYLDRMIKIGSKIIFNHQQEKGYGPEIYDTKTRTIEQFEIPNINTESVIQNEEYINIGKSNAVIMTPPGYSKEKAYPVLIWLHGGPLRQTSLGYHPYHSYGIYDSILKLLQKNDVIVLKLDYRGSYGVGRLFSEEIKGSVGSGDIDDVMEAVSYIHKKYNANKIYLSGNSYGGYMALKSVVEHPKTFSSILSINGVTDWESLLVDMKTSIFNTDFYGIPSQYNQKFYDQASIINKIGNLGKNKIEILQGEADRTIPLWQSVYLTNKLKEANKNVNLITYKGEDHVFKNKNNIGDICLRMFGMIGVQADKECIN